MKVSIQDYYRFVENRIHALSKTFSDWPRVLSENIPANGNIRADNPRPVNGYPADEIEIIIAKLIDIKEELRPTINAEVQYNDKMKVSLKLQLERAKSLVSTLDKELSN